MKKIYLIIAICSSSLIANAQTFWTEDFGTGCNRGQLVSAYTGPNGAWTTSSTGTNDPYANKFFVGAQAAGSAVGTCITGCTGTINETLHLSNVSIPIVGVTADTGASYFSGGLCSFGYCANTNWRAESPVINCTGKSTITIAFDYIENGDATNDDATLWYSADGGTTWSLLNNPAKTAVGSCSTMGTWTAYSFAMPASANNNATVKIGFNWTNNDDGVGTDPSFAVDNITLSTVVTTGIANVSNSELEIYSTGKNVMIKCNDVVKILGVYDLLGRMLTSPMMGNTVDMEAQPSGVYFVRVEVKGQVYTKKVFIE